MTDVRVADTNLIETVKTEARKLREENPNIKHGHAIEIVAKSHGFNSYAALRASVLKPVD